MQIVFKEDSLHEISKPIFWKKKKINISKCCLLIVLICILNVNSCLLDDCICSVLRSRIFRKTKMRPKLRFRGRICMVLLCIAQLWLLLNLYLLRINIYQTLNTGVLMFKTYAPSRLTNSGAFHLAHLNTENVFEIPLKVSREDKYNWNYTGNLNQDLPQFAPGLNLTEYKSIQN